MGVLSIIISVAMGVVWLYIMYVSLHLYERSRNEKVLDKSSGDVIFLGVDKKTLMSFPREIREVELGNVAGFEWKVKGDRLFLKVVGKELVRSNISVELGNGDVYGFEIKTVTDSKLADGFVRVGGKPSVNGFEGKVAVVPAKEMEVAKEVGVRDDGGGNVAEGKEGKENKKFRFTVDPGVFREAVMFETDDEGGIYIRSAVVINEVPFEVSSERPPMISADDKDKILDGALDEMAASVKSEF